LQTFQNYLIRAFEIRLAQGDSYQLRKKNAIINKIVERYDKFIIEKQIDGR